MSGPSRARVPSRARISRSNALHNGSSRATHADLSRGSSAVAAAQHASSKAARSAHPLNVSLAVGAPPPEAGEQCRSRPSMIAASIVADSGVAGLAAQLAMTSAAQRVRSGCPNSTIRITLRIVASAAAGVNELSVAERNSSSRTADSAEAACTCTRVEPTFARIAARAARAGAAPRRNEPRGRTAAAAPLAPAHKCVERDSAPWGLSAE